MLSVLFGLPFFLRWDAEARQDGVPARRRALAWAVLILAAPLGYGLYVGLLHRPRRRRT
ncbi:MAG TPA: hypothetical protein VNA20_08175 [Frankiaceae bacterium]|nr:hypothetical protein [Frankiaceae bacterium]